MIFSVTIFSTESKSFWSGGLSPANALAAGVDLGVIDAPPQNLLNHPEEAAGLAAQGREFVRERYTWEGTTERLAQLLAE